MKTIFLFLLQLAQGIVLQGDPGDIPTIVFGGMGSSCKDKAYINLVDKLSKGLGKHVECYESKVLGSMKS
jgi:hypothetical protein